MPPKYLTFSPHARKRLYERFGLVPGPSLSSLLLGRIKDRRHKVLDRQTPTRIAIEVDFESVTIQFVYNPETLQVLTVLPPNSLQRPEAVQVYSIGPVPEETKREA